MKTQDEVINDYLERHTPFGPAIRSELSGIWNNGYYHGYETAERKAKDKYEVDTNMQYNLGYQHGYDSGKDVAYKELSGWTVEEGKAKLGEAYQNGYDKGYATGLEEAQDQIYQNGYDKGADDARYVLWWAIKKLYLDTSEGGLTIADMAKIFGEFDLVSDVLRKFTPEEFIEKIKAYEESKKSAPTNRDKFEEVFPYSPNDISRVFSFGDNGIFIPDSWMDKPYKEPEE